MYVELGVRVGVGVGGWKGDWGLGAFGLFYLA